MKRDAHRVCANIKYVKVRYGKSDEVVSAYTLGDMHVSISRGKVIRQEEVGCKKACTEVVVLQIHAPVDLCR